MEMTGFEARRAELVAHGTYDGLRPLIRTAEKMELSSGLHHHMPEGS